MHRDTSTPTTSRWIFIIAAAAAAGCSTTSSDYGLRANAAAYAETNRTLWLTPAQRSYTLCRDGQPLVCEIESGRLSTAKCECP